MQHAAVITSSPFKNNLMEKMKTKPRKERLSKLQKTGKPKIAHNDPDDEPLSSLSKKVQSATVTKSSKKKQCRAKSTSSTDTTPCGTCSVTFNEKANNGRNWVQCQSCGSWHHNECQGLANNARPKQFVCISCE